jgi:hypothetical protein
MVERVSSHFRQAVTPVQGRQSEVDRPYKTAWVDEVIVETPSSHHEIRMDAIAALLALGLKT